MRHRVLLPLLLCFATSSQADDDRVQVGRDIVVQAHETLGDAVCIGCSIRVQGKLAGDAVTLGGGIEVTGSIQGDALAVAGSARLGPGAEVGGDLVVLGRLQQDALARVAGETVAPSLAMLTLTGLLIVLLSLILSGLCYVIAGRHRVQRVAEATHDHTGMAFLAGLGMMASAVVLYVLAAFTGPATTILAVVISLLLLVTQVFGYTGVSLWLGQAVARRTGPLGAVLIGAAIVTVLQLLPLANLLTIPIFALLALGSTVLSRFGKRQATAS